MTAAALLLCRVETPVGVFSPHRFSPSVLCSSFFASVSPPVFSFFFLFPFFLLLYSPMSSATTPAVVTNGGVAYGARLLGHLIMRWVASDFGSKARGRRDKGKKTKKLLFPYCTSRGRRRRNSAALKRHRFVSSSSSSFLKTHETASFCLKRAVSFK